MKLYSYLPSVIVSAVLGADKELESTVDKLIETSEIQDANDEKILLHEVREELPPHGFTK